MENKELVKQINKELAIALPDQLTAGELHQKLSAHINQLIQHDFEFLVRTLYRIDVSEAKIKSLLKNNPGENAGNIIASLIIERQLQKIQSREQFRSKQSGFDEEERW